MVELAKAVVSGAEQPHGGLEGASDKPEDSHQSRQAPATIQSVTDGIAINARLYENG